MSGFRLISVFTLLVLLAVARPAAAGLTFAFDSAAYVVDVGNTVDIQVLLRGDDPQIGPAGPGISSLGTLVSLLNAGVEVVGYAPNPAFDMDFGGLQPPDEVLLWPASSGGLGDPAALEVPTGSGNFEILVGTVTLKGLISGASVGLAAGDPDPGSSVVYSALADGTDLDALIQPASGRVTVTGAAAAVPEPMSLILWSLGAAVAWGLSVRRRASANK